MPLEGNRKKPVSENVEQQPASTVPEHKTKIEQPGIKSSRRRRRRASTYFPGTEGCLVPKICENEGIESLFRNLVKRFDSDDVVNQLLVELTVADYWRISQGLKEEVRSLTKGWGFHPQGSIPVATKYVAAARRNLDKSLQMMLQMEKEVEAVEALETESAGVETHASAADSSIPSQSDPSPMNWDEPAPDASSSTDEDEWIDSRDLFPQSAFEDDDEALADDNGDVSDGQASAVPPMTSATTPQPAGDPPAASGDAECANLQTEEESTPAQTEVAKAELPASETHEAGAEQAATASKPVEATAESPDETPGTDLRKAA
jgi:hypothetical protein